MGYQSDSVFNSYS